MERYVSIEDWESRYNDERRNKWRVGMLEHKLVEIRNLLLAPEVAVAASKPRDIMKNTHEGHTIWIDPTNRINVPGATQIQPTNDT